jgi:ABC-type transport system involved in Fe-S cluster assembly fused permease/ATPase subunit
MRSIHTFSPALTAVATFDYLHAPASILTFLGLYAFAVCTLQKPNTKVDSTKKRRLAILLLWLVVLANVTQAVLYFVYHVRDSSWTAAQHTIIRTMGSILTWSITAFALLGSKHPIWHPYIGSWLVGGVFEALLLFLSAFSLSKEDDRHLEVSLILGACRVALFIALLLNGVFLFLETRGEKVEKSSDEERQSLLSASGAEEANGSAVANGSAEGNGSANPADPAAPKTYGTTPPSTSEDGSDDEASAGSDDEEDNDKEIKEKQRKRLEDQGGWLGYLKGFAVFLPYLWPGNDWKGQLSLAVLGADIVMDRILNVMVPRQIGIVTQKLTEGKAPYKEVLIWAGLDWVRGYAGFGMLKSIASTYITNYSTKKISDLAFGHVMDLSMDFHSNKDSGEVLRAVEQAYALNELVEMVLFEIGPVLLDLCIAMFYVTHLFDIYLAFIVLSIGVIYVWLGITLTTWSQPARRTYVDKSRKENKTVYESISNWQTVTYFNRGEYERDRYKNAVGTTISAQWRYYMRSYINHGSQSLLITLGYCGVLLIAIWEISDGGKPIGNFVTLITYWETMMSPLYTMAYSYRHLSSTLIDAERLLQLLSTKSTVTNAETPKTLQVKDAKVEFTDVGFSYDKRKEVLKDINFVAEPGKTIAFVGETGGGKSTMLKLLFRFYDVTGGSITIDGQDIRDVSLSSLRDALGVVPQDPSLFNMSIAENIRYSRLDATDEDIQEACKSAAVHDKIMSFPDGYKSKVGERGVKLSGGELQRVAIARVLIKNPKIVMLDEATSAVDSSTEAQIQEAFKQLSAGRTTFVVAHRLSTIMEADLILVVDHGEIIERGTHEELLKSGGKYLELWTKQTAKPSKPNSIKDGDKSDVLIKDIPDTKYSEELAKSFTAGEPSGKDDHGNDDDDDDDDEDKNSGQDEGGAGNESAPLIDLSENTEGPAASDPSASSSKK